MLDQGGTRNVLLFDVDEADRVFLEIVYVTVEDRRDDARIVLGVVGRRTDDLLLRRRGTHRDRPHVAGHHTALADDFVEGDACGHRHVERLDVAEERQRDEVVAVFFDQPADATTLSPEDQRHGSTVVDRVPALGRGAVEAHDPIAA
jgi:hypothetical protein